MAGRIVLRVLKRVASHIPLSRQALIVRRVLPRRAWYRAALAISRAQGKMITRMGGNGALTSALMLDFWLRELSFGGRFPIPWKSTGVELCLTPEAKLYCWTHLPLNEVPMRVYLEAGGPPVAVVADAGKIVGDDEFVVFGWPERMQALPANGQLLSRIKSSLRAGKSVVFLADAYLGAPLSDLPLRLAARFGVPLFFQWAELLADGTIQVTYREAPYPYSRTEEELAANIAFLSEARERTLAALHWQG